jgi:hypothetical protein
VTAQVENLADAAFRGQARLVEVDGFEPRTSELPLPFGRGEPVPARGSAPVAGAVLAACRAVPDGDPQVGSEQSLTLEAAAEAPPDPDVPVWKLAYRFGDGWKFLRLAVGRAEERPIPGRPKAIGLWVHGDGGRTRPCLRVTDAGGRTWQLAAGAIDWQGWRYMELELSPATPHWGGARDGVLNYPLAWDSLFLLDDPAKARKAGAVYLASPVLIY